MKTLSTLILVLTIAFVGVASVGAQEPPADGGFDRIGTILDAVSSATGLTREQIVQMSRQDGKTLAEIISENGGDVDAVQAEIVAAFTADLNAQIEALDERVGNVLNNPVPQPNNNRPDRDQAEHPVLAGLVRLVVESSDLDAATIRQQLGEGMTLAEIASGAGLNPEDIAASALELFQERLDQAVANGRVSEEDVPQHVATFSEQLDLYMNTPVPQIRQAQQHRATVARAVLQAAADNLSVQPREVLGGIGPDQSMADYLSANGGDPGAVMAAARETLVSQIDQAIANNRLSQEDADTLLAGLDSALDEALNTAGIFHPRTDGPQDGRDQPPPPASDQQNG